MSDVFVSYASQDRHRILPLIHALEGTGWSIFWDRTIPAGQTWREVIGTELQHCRSMIVVWTANAIISEWVQEEAEIGRRKHILIPVLLDEIRPPLGFSNISNIQAADLTAWKGEDSSPILRQLLSDVSRVLASPPATPLPSPGSRPLDVPPHVTTGPPPATPSSADRITVPPSEEEQEDDGTALAGPTPLGVLMDARESTPAPRPLLPGARRRIVTMYLPAGLVTLLLAGAGLWYWDAYHRPHYEYHARVIKRWGLPEGVGALSAEQVGHRNSTLEIVKQGRLGPVTEVRVVNSRLGFPPLTGHSGFFSLRGLNPLENLETREGGLSMPGSVVARRVSFERGPAGRARAQRATNAAGRLLYALQYLSDPDVAMFGAGAFAQAVRESGITHLRFVRPDRGPEAGLDKEILFLDAAGRPQPDGDGSYGTRYAFSALGLPVEETNLNADRQPTPNKLGILRNKLTYDARGNLLGIVNLGDDGRPIPDSTGAAEMRMVYDQHGNLTEIAFFDKEGRLMTLKAMRAAVRTFAYDAQGNLTESTFRDPNRLLVKGALGFAKQKVQWDEERASLESYFGPDDKPLLMHRGRVIKARGVWNDRGYLEAVSYFDEHDALVRADSGCAQMRFEYDHHGNQIESACRDEGDLSVRTTEGWATQKVLHDERGNAIETRYFGPKDEPEFYEQPFVKVTRKYNEQGKDSEAAYFDAADRSVKHKDGYAKVTSHYNLQGQLTEVAFFDEQGHPVVRAGGYAKLRRTYDARGNLAEETRFDAQGTPVRNEDGYWKIKFVYDDRRYKTEETYFDENERPILLRYGFTKMRFKHNDSGQIVEQSLFGLDGALVAHTKHGYARARWTYDQRGNVSQVEYFGPSDSLTRTTSGYARVRYSYDSLGREIRRDFFDVLGAAVSTRVAIDEVKPGSKGERVGLGAGDVIVSYDGQEVADTRVFRELELIKGERPRELRIQRTGKILSVEVAPGRLTGTTVADRVPAIR